MKRGYIVCTSKTIGPLLKMLETRYPDLTWRSGIRPSSSDDRGPTDGKPFMLSPDPQLCYCDPYDPEHHPELNGDNLAFAQDLSACEELAAQTYGPAAPTRVDVTLKWLMSKRACPEGLRWFESSFGAKASVDSNILAKTLTAADKAHWNDWLAQRLAE